MTAFLLLETQWRATAGMAGLIWLGLDYAGAAAALGRKRFRTLLRELKAMEIEAVGVLNQGDEP